MTALAQEMGKGRPLSPDQQKHQQDVNKLVQANQAQKKGMRDKMMAWNQLQEDKEMTIQVPEQYKTPQGETEQLAYVTPEEMQMLKEQGGSGEMTPYGIPSFQPPGRGDSDSGDSPPSSATGRSSSSGGETGGGSSGNQFGIGFGGELNVGGWMKERGIGNARPDQHQRPGENAEQYHQRMTGGGGNSGGGNPYGPPPPVKTPEQIEAERLATAKTKYESDKTSATEKHEAGKLGRKRGKHVEGVMRDAQGRTAEDRGVMTDADGKKEGEEGFNFETAKMQGGFDESSAEMDTSGSFEGYKGEYKELGKEFGEDKEKLGAYQSKFDTMAGEAKTAADKGAGKMEGLGEKYKDITGDDIAKEAGTGATDIRSGADKIEGLEKTTGDVQKRQAGYESKIAGMADKAMSGDLGQDQAAMLKGQMEEGRMASQKGSEEKLRRELAQSGADPAEIAAKVAQFQKQSAGDQAQASRSEALSSQMQGQQMAQGQLGQAAGLTQQALGATGNQLQAQSQLQSQGAQQAALRGQAAGMAMQGAQAQQSAQLQSLQGQSAMAQGAYGMTSQGISQQAGMMGQGMGAVQAAGAARGQQAGMVDQQAGMTQAQLNDVIAQQTEQFQTDEAKKQREADARASSGGGGGGSGGILGGISSALGISDIRLKDSIKLLQEGIDGEPNIYSFKYKWDSKTTWSGVMAQELIGTKHADSVKVNPKGYYMVDYHKLGIPMVQLSAKE